MEGIHMQLRQSEAESSTYIYFLNLLNFLRIYVTKASKRLRLINEEAVTKNIILIPLKIVSSERNKGWELG